MAAPLILFALEEACRSAPAACSSHNPLTLVELNHSDDSLASVLAYARDSGHCETPSKTPIKGGSAKNASWLSDGNRFDREAAPQSTTARARMDGRSRTIHVIEACSGMVSELQS